MGVTRSRSSKELPSGSVLEVGKVSLCHTQFFLDSVAHKQAELLCDARGAHARARLASTRSKRIRGRA